MTRQLGARAPLILAIYGLTLLALMVPVVAYELQGTRVRYLFLDPASAVGAPFYLGLFSQLGLLLWCVAAAISLFTSCFLRRINRQPDSARLLLCFGLLTSLLLFDDLLMLHEEVIPTYGYIPEPVVLGFYGALALVCVAWFRRTLMKTGSWFLLLAIAFFAGSLMFDVQERVYESIPEDGLKLLGIVTWTIYLVRTSFASLASAVAPAAEALSSRLEPIVFHYRAEKSERPL
ncbi:MAG TPA: hypothetical protein VD930_00010 [Gemmatimonadales bacterium]|nr:hypothetical protein [Gemmatimonadales bacterium]